MVTVDECRPQDLTHLHPVARELARLPTEERLHRVRADRWIGYSKALDAVERLEMLFRWPSKQRMPNLLLVGPTNNGKSMIVERFRRTHPLVTGPAGENIPVVCMQMPSEPSELRFYTALLSAIGAPFRPQLRLP
jgi:hypothetical protein